MVRFLNYLQLRGVRPGTNTLTPTLEQYGGLHGTDVHVFADSGIEQTALAPARLRLQLRLPQRVIHAGERFAIGFTLENIGGRPAHGVSVQASFLPGALAPLQPPPRRPVVVESWSASHGFRALRAGRYRLALSASSNTNRPAALVDVPIAPADSASTSGRLLLLLGLILAAAGSAAIAWPRLCRARQ